MVSSSALPVEEDGSPLQTAVGWGANTGGGWVGESLSAFSGKRVMGIQGAQAVPEQCDWVPPWGRGEGRRLRPGRTGL